MAPPRIRAAFDPLHISIVVLVAAAGALSLWLEGYASRIDRSFALYMALVGLFAGWVAATAISTRRLLQLIVVAGACGYVTQYVGATLGGIWSYPPPDRTFYFVPAAFMLASLVAYGLTVRVLAPAWRRHLAGLPRWINLLVIAALLAVVVLASWPYRDGQGAAFWLYYGALFAIALVSALAMDLATLLALVASALLVGFLSESLGARSRVWAFDHDPDWLPPAWLILGSWPLEIVVHFSLSGAGLGHASGTARAQVRRPVPHPSAAR